LSLSFVGCGGGSPSGGSGSSGSTPGLIFSTYLGGSKCCLPGCSALTFAQNAAVDTQGNIYVTGATTVCDLPVQNAFQPTPAANSALSAFVAKYDLAGNLLWCTYLGGDNKSLGIGVAVMPDGGVAVAGLTSSDALGPFPTMNAFQNKYNGQTDYFVTVFDASGDMQYSTYLGGSGVEGTTDGFTDDNNSGNNVAVDAQGRVYITGSTDSAGGPSPAIPFPTQNAIQPNIGGKTDAFLSIIDPSQSGGSSLVYSSFLGGEDDEKGHGVAVDASGSHITVVGYTKSQHFPTTANAYRSQAAPPGYISNGFVSQFTLTLCGDSCPQYTNHYSTYLGADTNDARDDTYGVALDPKGLIVTTGRTMSADFPMTGPGLPSIYNSAPYLKPGTSGDEPYLVKIDPSLTGEASLVYSTFLGGGSATNGGETAFCTSVAVDSNWMAYVGGETSSLGVEYTPSSVPVEAPSLFPYTEDAYFRGLQGNYDAILMQISPNGATLDYSTFFGGTDNDRTYGLAVDAAGNVVLTGLTFSTPPSFPLRNPAQNYPGNIGESNAFVSKFSPL
jgi:hypothetical protein